MGNKQPHQSPLTATFSLTQLAGMLGAPAAVLLKHWWKIGLALLAGLFAGYLAGHFLLKPKYRAVYIIAAEEEQTPGIERLAAQIGLDMGLSNPGGVFRGESLVHLFLTRSMLERALLTPIEHNGVSTTPAALFFAGTSHAGKEVFKEVKFVPNQRDVDPLADSALYLTQKYLREKVLSVDKPDKKMGFIYVRVTHRDPLLAATFSKLLINTVKDFYIESVTVKARNNVEVLRNEADSVQKLLLGNLVASATATDLNINPLWERMRIEQNRSVINLQVTIALYAELMKNLKLAEIALRKQTPLIQVIEEPRFPLERAGLKPWQLALLAGFVSFAVAAALAWFAGTQTENRSHAS
ncbi:MAG: hypothetical protein IPM52_10545 [Bacteroidetes bacterium]|nr:hypothetical protein [Bacteroidota bacterium]